LKRYADAMDHRFEQVRCGSALPSQSIRQPVESGFVIIPEPTVGDAFNQMAAAYDEVMSVSHAALGRITEQQGTIGYTANRIEGRVYRVFYLCLIIVLAKMLLHALTRSGM
jgi:hypothetical protein